MIVIKHQKGRKIKIKEEGRIEGKKGILGQDFTKNRRAIKLMSSKWSGLTHWLSCSVFSIKCLVMDEPGLPSI